MAKDTEHNGGGSRGELHCHAAAYFRDCGVSETFVGKPGTHRLTCKCYALIDLRIRPRAELTGATSKPEA